MAQITSMPRDYGDRDRYNDQRDRYESKRTRDHSSQEFSRNKGKDMDDAAYDEKRQRADYRGNDGTRIDRDSKLQPKLYEPTNALCIRNMSYDASEAIIWEELKGDRLQFVRIITDKDTHRPRGMAFLYFPSIVDATNVITKYSSSSGVGQGKALAFLGHPCILEYSSGTNRREYRGDWICERCNTQNASKRKECKGCHNLRNELSIDVERQFFDFSTTAGLFVLIKGLSTSTTEEDLYKSMKDFASVKKTYLFRDSYSHLSRGYGVVEFENQDGASHTVNYKERIMVKGIQVIAGYANHMCIKEACTVLSCFPPTYTVNMIMNAGPTAPMNPTNAYSMPMPNFMYSMYNPAMYAPPYYSSEMMSLMPQPPYITPAQSSQPSQQAEPKAAAPLNSARSESKLPTVPHRTRQKLEDGRLFPSSYEQNSLRFVMRSDFPLHRGFEANEDYIYDGSSGFYYESSAQFYYCIGQHLYLDAVSGKYYEYKDASFCPFLPPPPLTPYSTETQKEQTIPEVDVSAMNVAPIIPTDTTFPYNIASEAVATPVIPIKFVENLKNLVVDSNEPCDEKKVEKTATTGVFLPGQTIKIEIKAKEKRREEEVVEEKPVVSMANIEKITGFSRSGKPACFVCQRQFSDSDCLQRHLLESRYHKRWMREWEKYHKPEDETYRNRAEERRKAVGSTAFHTEYRSGPPRVTNATTHQNMETTPTNVIPGGGVLSEMQGAIPGSSQPIAVSAIAQQLLEKEGWRSASDAQTTVPSTVSTQRTGLGYTNEPKKNSLILQGVDFKTMMMKKTEERFNQE